MPPKNMISVIRKTHMPITEASCCCSMLAKWCCRSELCASTTIALSLNWDLLRLVNLVVVVGFPRHDGCFVEVESSGRRSDLPFEACGVPGIRIGDFAITHRPQQVHHG